MPSKERFQARPSGRAFERRPWNEIASFDVDSSRSYAKSVVKMVFSGLVRFLATDRKLAHWAIPRQPVSALGATSAAASLPVTDPSVESTEPTRASHPRPFPA